jgi:hypothetical protein
MGSLKLIDYKGRPKYEFVPKPEFTVSEQLARIRYVEQEKERMFNGWEGLSGLHYFYLTKPLLSDLQGNEYHARFRMSDKKFFDILNWCKNHKLQEKGFPIDGDDHPVLINGHTIPDPFNFVVVKGRRDGLSTRMASTSLYYAFTEPGSQQGLTSNNDDNLRNLVSNKIKIGRKGCIQAGILTDDGRWNTKNLSFEIGGKESTIRLFDTAKDDRAASSVEGGGYTFFFMDEWFLHPRAELVEMAVSPAMLNPKFQKVGFMVQGGSCNAFTKKSVEKFKTKLNNISSAASKTKYLFIPAWVGRAEDEWGFDNQEKGTEIILAERQALRDANNYNELNAHFKSYPLTEQDIIGAIESDYFSPKIIYNLGQSKLQGFKQDALECNLEYKSGRVIQTINPIEIKGLSFPENNKFPYVFYESYQRGHLYGLGGDPIDFTGRSEIGSMCWMKVKDFTTNKYVADCAFRTQDGELGYNLWWWLVTHYNIGHRMSLWEKNRLGSLIQQAKNNNTLDYFARDPFRKTFTMADDVGYDKYKADVLPRLMGYGRAYLENNIVPSITFSDKFMKYSGENAIEKNDEIDAFLSTELLYNTLYRPHNEDEKFRNERVFKLVRNSQGFLEQKIETITKRNY